MNDYTQALGVRSPTEGAAGVQEWLVLVGWVGQWGQTPELLTSPQLESFLGGLQRLMQKCQASVARKKKKTTPQAKENLGY